ncbi:MAG: M48 family metallopeptidase [Gammaproteobacteria bacterium]|nr:M48 family metallopeptidase [Gammaproteobacteria bacterium]MBA3563211.1 M48 family metallopeptidase [Gammaproteobacteria bacterium]
MPVNRFLRSRSGRLRLWPLLIFGGFFAVYYFTHQENVPVTGRSQLVDISPEQEAALGLQSYREILGQADVVQGGEAVETVRMIGRRLAAVAEDPGFEWEFNVIDSEQVNAFALPGGKVAVFTGLLPVAGNDDALAVVMGHEIAHAIARHGAERMAHQKLTQYGALAVGVAMGEMDIQTQRMVMGALGVGAQYGVLMPFSRKHESEADYIGLLYVARACFDPTEAPALWERMAEGGEAPAEFLSTHPNPATRIGNFEEWMPEALRVREEHCAESTAP